LESQHDLDWSISNSTLEEVFLNLCVQNTSLNQAGDHSETKICNICNIEPTVAVELETSNGLKVYVSGKIYFLFF